MVDITCPCGATGLWGGDGLFGGGADIGQDALQCPHWSWPWR